MNRILAILVFCFGLIPIETASQLPANDNCDSLILTKEELQKCKADSVYANEILLKTKYISALKTELLPKYAVRKKKISLPDGLRLLVTQLKHIYDSTLNHKLNIWEKEMDENQKYIQPKAYISSLLSFQLFKFYPDVFGILLNDLHLKLNPKTTLAQIDSIRKLIDKITMQIPPEVLSQLVKITMELRKEKDALAQTLKMADLFPGNISDAEKVKYGVVNFLIWRE